MTINEKIDSLISENLQLKILINSNCLTDSDYIYKLYNRRIFIKKQIQNLKNQKERIEKLNKINGL